MGYGVDRTFSAQQWRVVVYSACGVLIAGIGLGVLVGRMTAPVPEPPPASASILPDVLPSANTAVVAPAPAAEDDGDEPAPPPVAPAIPAPPAPAPVIKVPPAPVVQKVPPPPERVVAAPKPERPAPPKHSEAKAKPAEPEPPADGARWVVQLGAFQSSDHAKLLVNTLAAHGQPAHVNFAQNAAGQGWFYVQTPPYRSAAAAKNAAQGLAAREHLPTYVLKLPNAG